MPLGNVLGHVHNLPARDQPRVPIEFEDGCKAEPRGDGEGWTLIPADRPNEAHTEGDPE